MLQTSTTFNEVKIHSGKDGNLSIGIDNQGKILHPISYKLDADPDNKITKVTLEFYANVDICVDSKAHNTTSTNSAW